MLRKNIFLLTMLFSSTAIAQSPSYRLPSGSEFAKVAPGGTTVLPKGRYPTPVGERLYTGDDLWNVVPSPDGKLVIGFCERFGLQDMPGMICAVDLQSVQPGLESVIRNNGMRPIMTPQSPLPKEIEYVVFITKENHTFDGIFGGLKGSTSGA
jgi:hypothetical protein